MQSVKKSKPVFESTKGPSVKTVRVKFEEFQDEMVLILPNQICEDMGLGVDSDVNVEVKDGSLIITKAK